MLFQLRFIVVTLGSWLAMSSIHAPTIRGGDTESLFEKVQLPLKMPRSRASVLGGPADSAEFTVWIPPGLKTARGIICNPFSKMEVPSPHWQAACTYWGFAYAQADFDAVKKEEYAPLLVTALQQLAAQTKHAELAYAPLCFLGMSRGGGMSMQLGELLPERTLACAPVCLEVGPGTAASRQIPVLTIFGDKDGSQLSRLLEKLPTQRSEDARWAIAVQWGRGHEFGQTNNLAFVFFDDVISHRLPKNASSQAGPVQLEEFPVTEGWLAGPIEWVKNQRPTASPSAAPYALFAGDKAQSVWLPSARSAAVWQALVSSSKDVKITAPAGLGDGQKFVALSASEPLLVTTSVSGKKPDALELWDADVKLTEIVGDASEFKAPPLKAGIHALIVKAIDSEGTRTSRPHTVVVLDSL